MITKEEFEKAVEVCNSEFKTCEDCPLRHKAFLCGVYLTKYIKMSLHLRQQAQARRYQKIPITHTLIIA